RAKELANRCNVPTVPSLILEDAEVGTAAATARVVEFGARIGYPLLIKASAGGGGRGMRRVDDAKEIGPALESAAREALAFFGDRRVFVEKLVLKPRHIEVQLLGDSHGDVTHLFDRDCTMQRRHQKVIEEAPAALLNPTVREKILACATALAREARYENAGTAEFLVDRSGSFFFLEVNSRLQVEHPVTEEHTGVDLVELQIRVAEGARLAEVLPSRPPTPRQNASIEVRLCAEDPDHGFAPSIGRIAAFEVPALPGVRVETGVDAASSISHYYDPMVAKVIATAHTRAEATALLVRALRGSKVLGVTTNIPYLIALLESAEFAPMEHDTKTAELLASAGERTTATRLQRAALCAIAARCFHDTSGDPWGEHTGFRLGSFYTPRLHIIKLHTTTFSAHTRTVSPNQLEVHLTSPGSPDGVFSVHKRPSGHYDYYAVADLHAAGTALAEGATPLASPQQLLVQRTEVGRREWITVEGESFEVITPLSGRRGETSAASSGELASPLPGKVLEVRVAVGDAV
ncbi:MAG: hypothetical protein EBZ48_15250, partial [Proteobacteria bacterium]|nr:hypothetical protein [Pseudomonadota bacterium]